MTSLKTRSLSSNTTSDSLRTSPSPGNAQNNILVCVHHGVLPVHAELQTFGGLDLAEGEVMQQEGQGQFQLHPGQVLADADSSPGPERNPELALGPSLLPGLEPRAEAVRLERLGSGPQVGTAVDAPREDPQR